MRLLTWNLNGRRQIDHQLAFVASRSPDIVALQELTFGSTELWRAGLLSAGLPHVMDSFACSLPWEPVGPRRYGLAIASRFPVEAAITTCKAPWPERLLSATVAAPPGGLTLHTTHIPPGVTNGWMKVDMLEAVSDVLSEASDVPVVLCGDFNTPQAETGEGRIVTWAEDIGSDGTVQMWKTWRGGPGHRWDAAERNVLVGGRERSLIDAYRHLHGYGRQEFSWFVKRKQLRIGRRFDHIFCSRGVTPTRCEYLHSVREEGLSDHSALELDFEL